MNNLPLISVLMSAYNCENTIKESVYSILNQTFTNFEFLIADDCSTDNTYAILQTINDPRIKLFQNEENSHLVTTWNKLSKLANSVYITFQDADDISYSRRLEVLYEQVKKDNSYAIVGANFFRPFKFWKQSTQSNYELDYNSIKLRADNFNEIHFYGTRSLFRKDIFDEVGGFRNFYSRVGWEDFDLFLRILEKYKVCNVKDILYEYRYYPTSSSKLKKSNISYKKYFINEIGFFLRDQRKLNNGLDGLMMGGDAESLNKYLLELEIQFNKDVSIAYRKIVKNQCSNKDFKNAFLNIRNAIKSNYKVFSNYFLFVFWVKALIKTIIKYILINFKILRN